MLQNDLTGQIVSFKLVSREEIVGKCVGINEHMIVLEDVFSLVFGNNTIQMIPFMFSKTKGDIAILPHSFLTIPEVAGPKLQESYKDAVSPIERAPAGMNVSSIIKPSK